jgi:peptidase inhibitor I78 family protein
MRKLFLLAPALLAACSTAPAQTPVHGVTPGHRCDATGTDQFIGQVGDSDTGAAIKRVSHAAVLRWAPPGVMLTMDYREDRVTVWLDSAKKITKIRCG